MDKDTIIQVIEKLIGGVEPVGSTETDNIRFENLKKLTEITDHFLTVIDDIAYRNCNSYQYSVQRAGKHCSEFLDKIGIKE